MDKIKLESNNIADENFEKLKSLFPNVVTEIIIDGKIQRAVDKDKLMQEINAYVLDGLEERYNFSWPDKRKSVVLANAPTRNTLRPCKEDSKDFDRTENLYIEGDNLEVLKLLRNTYMGKVKMIYIDPPYNTGKDFVYQDNFYINRQDYLENSGQFDEDGNRLFENTEANGRFHTDWLNMMYPRLKMARDLLTDDGVIFISIDDNEVHNLRKICDEIFGAGNFESCIKWRRRSNQPNDATKMIATVSECCLIYAKNDVMLKQLNGFGTIKISETRLQNYTNPDNDPKGKWTSTPWCASKGQGGSKYEITTPTGKIYDDIWLGTKDTFNEHLKNGRIIFPLNGEGKPRKKIYKSEAIAKGQIPIDFWVGDKFGDNLNANSNMKEIFQIDRVFDYSKPINYIKTMIEIATPSKDSIILDFFSGSATTAHAVMQLNAEDGGNRKYIMVQLPAETPEKSEARKAGYGTICEIGKERIRRAGEKIKKDYPDVNIDTGFRVFKLDSSNMEDVYYKAEDLSQQDINKTIINIKADRSEEDLLFQIILSSGIPLSCKIEIKQVNNRDVYFADNKYLLVCFEKDIDEKTIEELAKMKPEIMVFNQNTQDSTLANIEQIFKQISSSTIVKLV